MPLNLESLKDREVAIWKLKSFFENAMCEQLNLIKVSAPLILPAGKGINDDLNGVELIASFPVKNMGGVSHELPQSLAKWKRMALKTYEMAPGEGLITHMNAVRPDEDIDVTHSVFVEQWDWEKVLAAEDRNLDFLKATVGKVWAAIKQAEAECQKLTGIECILPETLEFVHSEELERRFPDKTPKEREALAVKENGGAVFVVGIGAPLPISGEIHDGRAPDYDDWITPTPLGAGLNGDILVWHPILEREFELSSMGIRVDKVALQKELEIRGCPERGELMFQQGILNDVWPLSVGGGVGQSRLTMFLLRRSHIGETVRTVWPDSEREACTKQGIKLLTVM